MKNSNDYKALVLDSLGEIVFYLDRDLQVKWSSEYAAELVRGPGNDPVGRFCYDLWCQKPPPCKGCPALKAMETVQIQRSEVCRDGKIWELHSFPVFGADRKVIGVQILQSAARLGNDGFCLVLRNGQHGPDGGNMSDKISCFVVRLVTL